MATRPSTEPSAYANNRELIDKCSINVNLPDSLDTTQFYPVSSLRQDDAGTILIGVDGAGINATRQSRDPVFLTSNYSSQIDLGRSEEFRYPPAHIVNWIGCAAQVRPTAVLLAVANC